VFGGAGAYDATYLLAYSAVSLGSAPLTGAALAGGLKKMVPPGTKVDVGEENINSTFTVLQAGNNIDFNGASGPLDFDVKTGEAPSDIQIWCLPKDANGAAASAKSSGAFFNAQTSKLEGQIGSICD
jgi:branched-chain amino acid transport system substrate-binding protein